MSIPLFGVFVALIGMLFGAVFIGPFFSQSEDIRQHFAAGVIALGFIILVAVWGSALH